MSPRGRGMWLLPSADTYLPHSYYLSAVGGWLTWPIQRQPGRQAGSRRDSSIDLIWKLPGIIELTYARAELKHVPLPLPLPRPLAASSVEDACVAASYYQKRISHDWLHRAIKICLPLNSALSVLLKYEFPECTFNLKYTLL